MYVDAILPICGGVSFNSSSRIRPRVDAMHMTRLAFAECLSVAQQHRGRCSGWQVAGVQAGVNLW
jgi:hypothetical protein